MDQPRLSGFTADQRAYELTADTAAQDMTKPDIVELRNIRAKVQMQDKSSMEMTAVRGIYDAKGRMVVLVQYNMDVADAWEFADWPEYPEHKTTLAYRYGINAIVYSMTH